MQEGFSLWRRLLALLINLISLVGGHFVVRRPDRGMLFFGLYLLLLLVAWTVVSYRLQSVAQDGITAITALYRDGIDYSLVALFVLWLCSQIVVLIPQTGKPVAAGFAATVSSIAGGILLSLLSVAIMFVHLSSGLTWFTSTSDEAAKSVMRSTHMYSTARYGESMERASRLVVPVAGSGYLQGRIRYLGEPAKQVRLTVKLNNKYEISGVETDEQGIFTLRLDPGEWYVNSVTTHSWVNKPEGDIMLTTGEELPYRPNNYLPINYRNTEGKRVLVGLEPGAPALELVLRPEIELTWPSKGDEVIQATTADVIAWQPVEGAGNYLVEISRVTREGEFTSWRGIFETTVDTNQLSIADVPTVTANSKQEEYRVEVTAFANNGDFITETGFDSSRSTFTLGQGVIIADDAVSEFLPDAFSPDDYASAIKEKEKAKAIRVLIREGMLTEANKLLDSLQSTLIDPGDKLALSGYLSASRGDCEQAETYFIQARSQGGKACVPAEYSVDCQSR